jgi:hypothetical protein
MRFRPLYEHRRSDEGREGNGLPEVKEKVNGDSRPCRLLRPPGARSMIFIRKPGTVGTNFC